MICTIKQGRITDREQDVQQFPASGLNLVIAIVYRKSAYVDGAVEHLRAEGKPVPPELLAHTIPLAREHITFFGNFLWNRAAAAAADRRPLNLW